ATPIMPERKVSRRGALRNRDRPNAAVPGTRSARNDLRPDRRSASCRVHRRAPRPAHHIPRTSRGVSSVLWFVAGVHDLREEPHIIQAPQMITRLGCCRLPDCFETEDLVWGGTEEPAPFEHLVESI